MFFKDLRLCRTRTIGVLAFIASSRARATDGLLAIASLMIVSEVSLRAFFPVQTIFRFLVVHEGSVDT